jgi:hypothetical protein
MSGPQDPNQTGRTLTFKTGRYGGALGDDMPEEILLNDAEGRSCVFVPLREGDHIVVPAFNEVA